ncbi:MAG: hypothetical protein GX055_01345 [Desulfovibrionales bacterium]|nr:hypothetical protein [Desulfovibrionales bacterium]
MTQNQNENALKSPEMSQLEEEILTFRAEQALLQKRIKTLLLSENPEQGLTYHEEIFRMQQDKLRMDTEIQIREVKLRRLKATW